MLWAPYCVVFTFLAILWFATGGQDTEDEYLVNAADSSMMQLRLGPADGCAAPPAGVPTPASTPVFTYARREQQSGWYQCSSTPAKHACGDYNDCVAKARNSCDSTNSCFGYYIPRDDGSVTTGHSQYGYYLHTCSADSKVDADWDFYVKQACAAVSWASASSTWNGTGRRCFECCCADYPSSPNAAFDGDTNTVWDGCCTDYPNQVLTATLASSSRVARYALMTNCGECPSAWIFEGSNDGSVWAQLDNRSGQACHDTTFETYDVATPGIYSSYRFRFTGGVGGNGNGIRLREVALGCEATLARTPAPTSARPPTGPGATPAPSAAQAEDTPAPTPGRDPTRPEGTPAPTPAEAEDTPAPTPGRDPTRPEGTPAPTPAEAESTVTAFGDPHLKNMRREKFEVRRPGVFMLLNVPQGAAADDALLRIDATMERAEPGCSSLFITRLHIAGQWLHSVPPLSFAAGAAPPGEAGGAVLKVGNSSALAIEEFMSRVPRGMVKFTLPNKEVAVPKEVNKHATLMTATLKLGPGVVAKVSWTLERTPSASLARSLWVSMSGLSAAHGAVGGLLGLDDHHHASTPDAGCGGGEGERSLQRRLKEALAAPAPASHTASQLLGATEAAPHEAQDAQGREAQAATEAEAEAEAEAEEAEEAAAAQAKAAAQAAPQLPPPAPAHAAAPSSPCDFSTEGMAKGDRMAAEAKCRGYRMRVSASQRMEQMLANRK